MFNKFNCWIVRHLHKFLFFIYYKAVTNLLLHEYLDTSLILKIKT